MLITSSCLGQVKLDDSSAVEIIQAAKFLDAHLTLELTLGEKVSVAETRTGSLTSTIPLNTGEARLGSFAKSPRVGADLYKTLASAGLIRFNHLGGYEPGWKGYITYYEISLTEKGEELVIRGIGNSGPRPARVELNIAEKFVRGIESIEYTNEGQTEAVVRYMWEARFVDEGLDSARETFQARLKWALSGTEESYLAYYDGAWHVIT